MDDLLESLIEKPHDIFKYFKPGDESASNEFNSLTKSFLDPYTKKYSVLDEIYIDGLDSTQVFGQSKMVFDAVGEYLLSTGIPEVRQKFDLGSSLEAESDDDENDGSEDLALGDEIDDEAEGFESEDDNDVHDDDVETSDKFDSENEQFDSDDEGDIGSDEATTLRENSEEDEQDSDAETHVEAEIETKKDAFGLNDEFFDIDEYNRQVVELENDENNNDDEQIDFFADLSDEDSEEEDMAYYDEFFDKPGSHLKETSNTKKPVKIQSDNIDEEEDLNEKDYDNAVDNAMLDLFADEEEDDDDNNSQPKEENLSSFEKQQQKLQKEIEKLEAELVADKKMDDERGDFLKR
jgi:U3 small nucleolar RNA-associated protein MPP10